jgi:hypothetical protein
MTIVSAMPNSAAIRRADMPALILAAEAEADFSKPRVIGQATKRRKT